MPSSKSEQRGTSFNKKKEERKSRSRTTALRYKRARRQGWSHRDGKAKRPRQREGSRGWRNWEPPSVIPNSSLLAREVSYAASVAFNPCTSPTQPPIEVAAAAAASLFCRVFPAGFPFCVLDDAFLVVPSDIVFYC